MNDPVSDTLQHVRQLLLASPALTALVAPGAICLEEPRTATGAMPAPSVIFQVETNRPGNSATRIQQIALSCTVVSRKSQGEALQIYELVRSILDMARLYSGVSANGDRANKSNGYIRQVNGAVPSWHEPMKSWLASGRYVAFTGTLPT